MAFPLLLIPLAICNIIVFLMPDLALSAPVPLFSIPLMSKDIWTVTLNDVLVALGILLLLLEVTRAARPAAKYFTDHFLSLLVFGAAAAEFVMLPKFGNSTFFLITLIAMVDFFAGISLRARRPRRVVAVAPEPVRAAPAPHYEPPAPMPVPAAVVVPPAAAVAEAVLIEHPEPAKVEPKVETRIEPKLDSVVEPRPEFQPIPPEVVAQTSPQITSPDLQPGNGAQPSKDVPPATR
ncbi:hypothetical protein [Tardiphaga sp.]|uniref:hypothetical protein n=1 Tax=Tardiphaga sp. TaxID=1926292 RepID=UPI00261FEC2F|nr:hypothetical protein [Tardiphaga sp.]MDB5620581.1 hypothetical protein [Tardiphaga sp.]